MKLSSLCYLEKDGKYLMLYRNKKKNDENAGKWIGVGGKFEENESPLECMRREVLEETGFLVKAATLRSVVTFVSDCFETEYMFLYTVTDFEGRPLECSEGELSWIPKDEIYSLSMWEGDRIFLELIAKNEPYFDLKLVYKGESLVSAILNGKAIR